MSGMPASAPPGLAFLAPLRVRNYRVQWPADLLTSWAFEMEVVLLGWYVLTQSNSVLLVSVIGAMPFIGTLLSPVFGMVGDRIGLRNLLCLMRCTYLFNSLLLLVCAMTGMLSVGIVIAIAFMTGLVRPSDLGVRTALVANTVAPGVLPNAMGLSRTTFDSARIFGALSGASLFAVFGLAAAYVLVAGFYLGGLLMTLAISPSGQLSPGGENPATRVMPKTSPLQELKEGFLWILRTPKLLAGICLACLVNFAAFPFSIGLMPYVARNVFGGDERTLGYLLASFATGALCGSIILMLKRKPAAPARMMILWVSVWFCFVLIFARCRTLEFGMAAQFGAGLGQSLSMVSLALMLLQTTEHRVRGRVMGIRMMAIYMLPVGLMSAGMLIPHFGFTATATAYATVGLLAVAAIAVTWRKSLWPHAEPEPHSGA